jgi:ATP-binding cassette subfamily B protein
MSEKSTQAERPRRHGGPMGGPGRMAGEKPKDFKKSLGQLLRYSRRYLIPVILALICAAAGSISTLFGPDRMRDVTDIITAGLMTGIDLPAVVSACVNLTIIYVAGAVLVFIQGWTMTTVTQKLSKSLRTDITGKINRLPLKYFDTTTHGNILSRVTNDVDTINQTLNQSIGQLVTSITMFFGSILMMFLTDAVMAATAVLSTVLGFAVMMIIIKRTQKYFTRNQRHLGEINGLIEEVYAGHNIVKAYNGEREAKREFDEINEKLYESNWKSQFLSGLMMPLMHFIGNFGYVAVCVVGALRALNGDISFGVIVAFIMYVRLFTQPLQQIAQSMTAMQSTAAASERVFEFLGETEMPDESGKTAKLDNVTGAGKTTMVNLLMRFYDTLGGVIKIDGVSIADMTRQSVHDLFCMVLQDTWLFEGTIKENIVYSKRDIDDESVVDACKAVGLDHFIRTLPHGYKTTLDDKTSLSEGQRQLLTIARAIVDNAPLLILDEATSSVDPRTETLVQNAMDKLTVGRTAFVIAHRLSTIRNADIILVMNEGDIVESGSHTELLARGGFYATLYNSQFEE